MSDTIDAKVSDAQDAPTPEPVEAQTAATPEPQPVLDLSAADDADVIDVSSVADSVIDTVVVKQQEVIETAEATGAAILSSMTKVQRELADFVSERLREDMEARHELLRCRSFAEIRDVQTRFVRTALSQYSTKVNRLVKLGGETVAKSLDRNA